ncbi:hypothetical protein H4217_001274 [Coemansia sp. RSA 1939]|nr:hypothetical protein H4217_001274 [Coemansia sp. RSA 1939]KAJ2616204.1 hypothetical protein EV177_001182 [Coemansia sp. RSA 1804]
MARILSVASIVALLTVGALAHPGHVHVTRRQFGYNTGYGAVPGYGVGAGYGIGTGYGVGTGYGIGTGFGFGFPIASSFTNALNTNFNAAHFNDDTVYLNNKDANTVNSNLNTFTNANVVA